MVGQAVQRCLNLPLTEYNSRHVLNAQVSIRAPCCMSIVAYLHRYDLTSSAGRKWYDCAQCHHEQEKHQLLQKFEMVWIKVCYFGGIQHLTVPCQTFACKKCRKCFRKDAQEFDERLVFSVDSESATFTMAIAMSIVHTVITTSSSKLRAPCLH